MQQDFQQVRFTHLQGSNNRTVVILDLHGTKNKSYHLIDENQL